MQENSAKELQAQRILNFEFKRKNQKHGCMISAVLVAAGVTFYVAP